MAQPGVKENYELFVFSNLNEQCLLGVFVSLLVVCSFIVECRDDVIVVIFCWASQSSVESSHGHHDRFPPFGSKGAQYTVLYWYY